MRTGGLAETQHGNSLLRIAEARQPKPLHMSRNSIIIRTVEDMTGKRVGKTKTIQGPDSLTVGNFADSTPFVFFFIQKAVSRTVSPGTAAQYLRQLQTIQADLGIDNFTCKQFIEWMAGKFQKDGIRSSTLRTYKSACLHMFYTRPGLTPWNEQHAKFADMVLDGMARMEKPTKPRGQVTPEQFKQIMAICEYRILRGQDEYKDIRDGMKVIYGCCLRGRDIVYLVKGFVHFPSEGEDEWPTVWANVKNVQLGAPVIEPHPVIDGEVRALLQERTRTLTSKHDLVFPGWDMKVAAEIVKRAAADNSWDENRLWTGPHNLRHGAAKGKLDEALEYVRLGGAWKSAKSAAHYSKKGMPGRPDEDFISNVMKSVGRHREIPPEPEDDNLPMAEEEEQEEEEDLPSQEAFRRARSAAQKTPRPKTKASTKSTKRQTQASKRTRAKKSPGTKKAQPKEAARKKPARTDDKPPRQQRKTAKRKTPSPRTVAKAGRGAGKAAPPARRR